MSTQITCTRRASRPETVGLDIEFRRLSVYDVAALGEHFPRDWNLWGIDEWPAKLAEIAAMTALPIWVSECGASSFGAEDVQEFGLEPTAELLIGRAPRIHWYNLYDLPQAWPATTRHREAEGSSYYRHFYIERALAQWPVDLIHSHALDFADHLPMPGVPTLVTLHLPVEFYPPGSVPMQRPRSGGVLWISRACCRTSKTGFRSSICRPAMRAAGLPWPWAGSAPKRGSTTRSTRHGWRTPRCCSPVKSFPTTRISAISPTRSRRGSAKPPAFSARSALPANACY
jgi:hypothetical protein